MGKVEPWENVLREGECVGEGEGDGENSSSCTPSPILLDLLSSRDFTNCHMSMLASKFEIGIHVTFFSSNKTLP